MVEDSSSPVISVFIVFPLEIGIFFAKKLVLLVLCILFVFESKLARIMFGAYALDLLNLLFSSL
jgi:hypothetical protein